MQLLLSYFLPVPINSTTDLPTNFPIAVIVFIRKLTHRHVVCVDGCFALRSIVEGGGKFVDDLGQALDLAGNHRSRPNGVSAS
jgi:hypothetical protein